MASGELTARGAVEAMRSLEGVTEALRRRTAGMTWMIWGFVVPAIFLSYNALGATGALDDPGPWLVALLNVLWAPWVAIGVLATRALWRSAALPMAQDVRKARRDGVLQGALFVGAIFGLMAVVRALDLGLVEPGSALLGVALASLASGALNLNCDDRTDRLAWTYAGLFLLAVVLVTWLATPSEPEWLPFAVFGTVAPLATAIAYVGAGIWLSLRG